MEHFLPVLNAFSLERLGSLAITTRAEKQRNPPHSLLCSVQTPPNFGSFNAVFTIVFSDGVKWIARIPGNGLAFGPLDRQRMLSAIYTTSLIRLKTSIPVPEIFSWDVTSDTLGVPFTLESFVEGSVLAERWDDWASETKRLKVLRNLAAVMAELSKLEPYDKIGILHFTTDGQFSYIGETVLMEPDFFGEDSVWGTKYVSGPFDTTKSWLLRGDWKKSRPPWRKAELAILHLAIESIPENLLRPYVLGHPDFNYQNIFVDDDANILGIIDWDGVSTRPRSLGFARYPSWITRDWDPVKYGYGIPGSRKEDSPQALLIYRREYATAMAQRLRSASNYSRDDTMLSHLMEAIEIAAEDPICRSEIVKKLLQHAFDSKVPFTQPEFFKAYENGVADVWVEAIKEAFNKMWRPEWLLA